MTVGRPAKPGVAKPFSRVAEVTETVEGRPLQAGWPCAGRSAGGYFCHVAPRNPDGGALDTITL